jgi:toxin YoeB
LTCEILWTPTATEHLEYWRKADQKKILKIKSLCQSIAISPENGEGKPERLKFQEGRNIWSRRIDQEHRLVYEIKNDKTIFILQCRYHY